MDMRAIAGDVSTTTIRPRILKVRGKEITWPGERVSTTTIRPRILKEAVYLCPVGQQARFNHHDPSEDTES